VTFGTFAAVFAGIYPFMTQPAAVIAVGFVLVALAAAFLTLCLGTVPEFFPTAFRFRGGGFAQTVGRIGLIVSPFVVLWLYTSYGIVGVILAVSGMYLAVTVLYAAARLDTSREALEQIASGDSADGEPRDATPSASGPAAAQRPGSHG
jgi:putative MFS transporter